MEDAPACAGWCWPGPAAGEERGAAVAGAGSVLARGAWPGAGEESASTRVCSSSW